MNKFKIDLHTHSIISHDGGLTEKQYTRILEQQELDFIAITDHNETSFARIMQSKLGERIIIGEEIRTTEGEIIGLFLKKTIPADLTPEETVKEIREQDGIVYIPHPLETFRRGLQADALKRIAEQIDIVEIFNGRGRWRNKNLLADEFVSQYGMAIAASSDAHCPLGIGKTYSMIRGIPMKKRLKKLLRKGDLQKEYAPLLAFLCPVINRIKNKVIV
jgi:predicted metal-dependent phosphoesterase TrpH